MCSIFGTFGDDSVVKDLHILNNGRGHLTSSASIIRQTGDIEVTKTNSELKDYLLFDSNCFRLYHQQAPTTQESNTIHPSVYKESYLWHNGIVKICCINELKNKLNSSSNWDTQLLNQLIVEYGIESLKDVDGSFSCIWWTNNTLRMFRNQISPMFFDLNGTISSVEFNNSVPTTPNTVYELDLKTHTWNVTTTFNNNELPFFYFD